MAVATKDLRRRAFAAAAWRRLEQAWRDTGSLAALATGFQPDGYPEFPPITVTDAGRLDRLTPVCAARTRAEAIELRLPHAIADIWVDFDDLGDEVIEAIVDACRIDR